jgi:hypothetical protein
VEVSLSLSKKLLKLKGVSSPNVDVIAPDTTCPSAGVDFGLWGVDGSAARIKLAEGTGKVGMLAVGRTTGLIPTGCADTYCGSVGLPIRVPANIKVKMCQWHVIEIHNKKY